MNIVTTITVPSQGLTGSLSGRLQINEGLGRLSISDTSGRERTRLDVLGLTTSDIDGTERLRAGISRSTGETILAITDPGDDLRDDGI